MKNEVVNKQEAPKGFYAIPKSSLPKDQGNLCGFCDFRPTCKTKDWGSEDSSNRCMSYPVVSFKSGKIISRADKCSVVFKKVLP